MARLKLGRRDFIWWSAGAAAGCTTVATAFAQSSVSRDILGLKIPGEIIDLIPEKPLNLARTIASIVALEKEADAKNLPSSVLAFDGPTQQYPTSESSLYQAALPRLVTLIDRSEGSDPGMADQAGAILADVHASQHVVPESLKLPAQPAIPPQAQVPEPPIPISRARSFNALKDEYARLFGGITLRSEFSDTANWHLTMMKKARSRYEGVGNAVGVPWYFIAAIHGLEASFNFRAHLHNGDFPLTARTRQVPSGRPLVWLPPDDWESSAKDALRLLGFANQKDWSLERTLYRLEAYNGFGYRRLGVPSPYLWSFSNHYERGKFVADGSWSAKARSQQCGAAVMLKLLADAGDVKAFG